MRILSNHPQYALENHYKKQADICHQYQVTQKAKIQTLEQWKAHQKSQLERIKQSFPKEMFRSKPINDVQVVSKHEFTNYRIENVLFSSFEGWYVNATVYLPKEKGCYPGIVCPTGHSSKTFPNYVISNQVLAQNGFITVSFDPPGMRGEHQKGSDHFEDGVMSYLSGFWSNAFFVYDAIRCLDYLETRDDVKKDKGFGMTGVSGGGHTSIYAALLDERIKAVVPVCCISDLRKLLLEEFYTSCPETMSYQYLKNGFDNQALIELLSPKPCLVISGKKDEVFDHRLTQKIVKNAKKAYRYYDKEQWLNTFNDEKSGHGYTKEMAQEASLFFHQHMGYETNNKNKEVVMEMPNKEQLLCHPKDQNSMYDMNLKKIREADQHCDRNVVEERFMAKPQSVQQHKEKGEIRWDHCLSKVIYEQKDGYQIPGLLLERVSQRAKKLLIFCDDQGKWTGLENQNFLTQATGLLSREVIEGEKSVLSLDLSGFGELKPQPASYDLADWNRKQRILSYIAIFLGDSILGKRVRELVDILFFIKQNHFYDAIDLGGRKKAALPVLIAAYLFQEIDTTYLIDLPISFETLAHHVPNDYLPDAVFYDAPNTFDIATMMQSLKKPILINPRNGDFSKAKNTFEKAKVCFTEENQYDLKD